MSRASASPLVVQLARAFAGRGADVGRPPAPPLRWTLDDAYCGGAIRYVATRVRSALAPLLATLDLIARPLASRPLLFVAAMLVAIPLVRLAVGTLGEPGANPAPLTAPLMALLGVSAVLGFASSLHAGSERTIVVRALLGGFVLRAALLLAIAWRGPFPDEHGIYHALANSAAGSWSVGGSSILAGHPVVHHREAYFYLLAWTYHLGGADMLLGRVLGCVLGLLGAVLAGEVARALGGKRAAAIAVALVALHPEHAFWSITLSRDTLTTLLVLTVLAVVLRRPGRLLGAGGVLAAAPFLLLAVNSFPLAGALGAALFCVAAGEAACAAGWSLRGVLLPVVVGTSAIGALVVLGYTWGGFFAPTSFTAVRGSLEPGTDFLPGLELHTILDVALLAPLGVLFVLFAPFPWHTMHAQRAVYGVVAIAGHVVTLLGIAGLWHAARRRPAAAAPVVAFLLCSVLMLGVLEGRTGIVVRHRLPLTALLAVGAAVLLAGLARRPPEDP